MSLDLDDWAKAFFVAMLEERLSPDSFEEAIRSKLQSGGFVFRAPRTAAEMRRLSRSFGDERDAGYASAGPVAGFRSQWLVGKPGIPGAVHIDAPPERSGATKLCELNRPPHRHDTGRIGLISAGNAVFEFVAKDASGACFVVDCPVREGDLIFWPAWTPHTFDARDGFSVLSAMSAYVSPREDGFVLDLDPEMPDPDSMPRISIDDFLASGMRPAG